MNLWDRLDLVADQRSVLRHPFYQRWSEGTLTRPELAHYSGQYRHAVIALADASAAAAASPEAGLDGPALAAHADEEAAHIPLWDEFVSAVGGDPEAQPNAETRACAEAWRGDSGRSLLETLVALYAIESAQPAISATKQAGLSQHYGIAPASYFDVHQRLDVEHAEHARDLIEHRWTGAGEDALVDAAASVLKANWLLLDGVEAAERR